jgi:DNA-binding phage protein
MSTVTIRDFDPANYLDNDEVIVEYLKATAEDPNPEVFLEALRPGAHPRYETVKAVHKAVGVEMTFKQVT